VLAVCIEAFVKHHSAMSLVFLKRQCKNVLRWDAVNNQIRKGSKTEPTSIIRNPRDR
jgi:hypothetical protein